MNLISHVFVYRVNSYATAFTRNVYRPSAICEPEVVIIWESRTRGDTSRRIEEYIVWDYLFYLRRHEEGQCEKRTKEEAMSTTDDINKASSRAGNQRDQRTSGREVRDQLGDNRELGGGGGTAANCLPTDMGKYGTVPAQTNIPRGYLTPQQKQIQSKISNIELLWTLP